MWSNANDNGIAVVIGYRAELWVKPYNGHMLACTRTVRTKRQARVDAWKCFRLVERKK
jgi:hypothetical protein